MRLRRKLRRSTKQYFIVALICIVVIGSTALGTSIIIIGQIRAEYEFMLDEARCEINNNKKRVLLARSNINTGEILSMDMVEEGLVYTSQPVDSFITKEELGKPVMIDINEGTHILKSMLADNLVSSALREIEYDVIHIGSNIQVNDYIDVMILYPNGENFVVLSKKLLKGLQPDTSYCYLWVDEEELLRMSAAIVDAGLYPGSRLYMTRYIEANIQDPSIITYTPSISVLSLIENDPNIINRCSQVLNKEVRKALENRLARSMDIDVKEIQWDINGETIYVPETKSDQLLEEGYMNGIDKETDNILGYESEKELDKGQDIKHKIQDRENDKKVDEQAEYQEKLDDLTDKVENHIREPNESYFPELGYFEEADYVVTEDKR